MQIPGRDDAPHHRTHTRRTGRVPHPGRGAPAHLGQRPGRQVPAERVRDRHAAGQQRLLLQRDLAEREDRRHHGGHLHDQGRRQQGQLVDCRVERVQLRLRPHQPSAGPADDAHVRVRPAHRPACRLLRRERQRRHVGPPDRAGRVRVPDRHAAAHLSGVRHHPEEDDAVRVLGDDDRKGHPDLRIRRERRTGADRHHLGARLVRRQTSAASVSGCPSSTSCT